MFRFVCPVVFLFWPYKSLIQVYQAYIQTEIDYAITVWGYTSKCNIDKIQHMQNRAARIICNNYDFINTRGITLVRWLNFLNVSQRRDYFMSVLVFKSIHGLAPHYLCDDITMQKEVSSCNTRNFNENDVHIPYTNSVFSSNAFTVRGPIIWNDLPSDVKCCDNINVFKAKCKAYFINVLY